MDAFPDRTRLRSLHNSLGGVLIVAGLLVSWAAPSAQAAAIYWHARDAIGSANLDGTGVNQSFVAPSSGGYDVAVDGNYVYWANGLTIGRANRDGTGVDQSFITGAGNSNSGPGAAITLDVDGNHIYWGTRQSINRTNLDGTGANQYLFETYGGGTDLLSLAVDETYIYYALQASVMGAASSLGRANLDGTGRDNGFIPLGAAPFGVAVDDNYLYLAFGDISRANLDGTGLQSFITGGFDAAVYGDHIYWANTIAGTIGRANLDGTDVNQNFITGLDHPNYIVVIPEPATGLLVMLGLLGLAGASHRH